MRRFILFLALIAVCSSAFAQKLTKEERRALREQRKVERDEYYRLRDSLYWAEEHRRDSLRTEERKKEGATEIVVTAAMNASEAIDHIARELINSDHIISVNKEYGTITTQPKSAGMAAYSLYFRISGNIIRACAFAHTNVGIAMHGIVSMNSAPDKIENRGMQGSLNKIAFSTYEAILLTIPGATLQYIKE